MRVFLTLLLITAMLFISGCETFHGLGRDFENAGKWIQDKAR